MSIKNAMKKYVVVFLAVIFAIAITLYLNHRRGGPFVNFTELAQSDSVFDLQLTIYGRSLRYTHRFAIGESKLMGGTFDYKVIITGETLSMKVDELSDLDKVDLTPVEGNFNGDVVLAYAIELKGREILRVSMYGICTNSNTVVAFVNGVPVTLDERLYNIVLPFIPTVEAEFWIQE